MRIGVIILSRLSSTRLPGKALREIQNKPVLLYIVERLQSVVPLSEIVLATSDDTSDDRLAAYGNSLGLNVFRGSLANVSERFVSAAEFFGFDFAVRINGDNIFLDTKVLNKMLQVTAGNQYDFLSNVKDRTFPKGMSIEIVRVSYFKRALSEINKSDLLREHVTLYLYENGQGSHYYFMNTELPEAAGIQLALDTQLDFERTERIISNFTTAHVHYNLPEILNIWKKLNYD